MPAWLIAVVAALACYRLTLLIVADNIFAPQRDAVTGWLVAGGRHRLAALLECPWCVSVWVAPPVVGSAIAWGDGWGWVLVAGSLASAAVTGVLATLARP